MRIHFIAIGGSAMHNLAIALHHKGYRITGSDDEIFEPSRGRLARLGLLPEVAGWFPEKITSDLDAVISGMHAHADNPELEKAKQLGLKIYSYPEFLFMQTMNKTRVVVGGSHGKTTITSMIMHVLQVNHLVFDYMVGAQVKGFDTMVGLHPGSDIAVFEGDEYPSSPDDLRPKFHLYNPHIAILSGIAWDHINVFPTFDVYVEQFRIFSQLIQPGGQLFYCGNDEWLQKIAKECPHITTTAYYTHPYFVEDQVTYLKWGEREIRLKIFGEHNLQNISAAKLTCNTLGITDDQFYNAIRSFEGASNRLEVIGKNDHMVVFRDFAHSPSKVKATTSAAKNQFPGRKLVTCLELHTYSSLKKEFLPCYAGTLDDADEAFVFYSPHTIEMKRLEQVTPGKVLEGFAKEGLKVFTDAQQMFDELMKKKWDNCNLLLMSSGNFGGMQLTEFAATLSGEQVRFQRNDWIRNPQSGIHH